MKELLRKGSRGADVRRLQAVLNRLLKPIPLLKVDGDFGEKTDRAVRAFQKREQLSVDGVVGPKTWAALEQALAITGGQAAANMLGDGAAKAVKNVMGAVADLAAKAVGAAAAKNAPSTDDDGAGAGAPSAVAELAVQIALTQTHVREEPPGSNRGPMVDQYIRAAGEDPAKNIFWCMAFVYWAFGEAAGRLGIPHPMQGVPPGYRDYCTGVARWAKQNNLLVDAPQRGDIFLVPGGTEGRTHKHTGLVTDVQGGMVATVEGNTNNDGSRNGIGVFCLKRAASRLDYIRL